MNSEPQNEELDTEGNRMTRPRPDTDAAEQPDTDGHKYKARPDTDEDEQPDTEGHRMRFRG